MKTMRVLVVVLCGLAAGCDVLVFVTPEGPPSNKQIYAQYQQTILKQSTSADVLSRFGTPKDALLSQSKSIAALAGITKQDHKMWFNMVSFDESELIAKRKYYFIYNERPKQLLVDPWEGLDFGCQMVLSKEILDEPYADENARRIAILKKVDADTRKDTMDIGSDNAMLSLNGMMAGQGMESLLIKLNASPALAVRLSEPNGVEFDHINLDKGRLRMVIDNDIVTVKMRLGSFGKSGKVSVEGLDAMED
ncbi:MAG: hypothetical protein ABSB11_03420 [Sedimentisphaerales bacterium]|jgi:hypothetical protein